MKSRWSAHILFLLLLLSPSAFAGEAHKYQVVSVVDGDTFIATDGNIRFKVRIAAMDAPERGQPYSKLAKYRLASTIQGKEVTIRPIGKGSDRYGRTLGLVLFEERDLAQELISDGLAIYYRPLCRDFPADKEKYNYDPTPYIQAENTAKQRKRNIWSDARAMLPCHYRQLFR